MITTFGHVRIAAAVPPVRAAAVTENVKGILQLAERAADQDCDAVVFPELCLTGYTCADLFQQRALLQAVEDGLQSVLTASSHLDPVYVVGAPVVSRSQLFNAAVVIQHGTILGVVPKTFIPGYSEYYEPRWFVSGDAAVVNEIRLCGTTVPFGTNLVFQDSRHPDFRFGVELCEDLWAPIPPSSRLALGGALVLLNCSASNELVGKAEYRRQLVAQQSGSCLAAYVYCSAGVGESTTDTVFGGHAIIAENGAVLAEGDRFRREPTLTVADIDVEFLEHERVHNATFGQAVARGKRAGEGESIALREVGFESREPSSANGLERWIDPHPFTPGNPARRRERCQEIFAIQSTGLATRLQHTGIRDVVIGLSGGLDSTLALLVIREAFSRLELPSAGIHCITMPGFGTSNRTLGNVQALCQALDVPLELIDIGESCRQHMHDIGHDGATGDIAFENVQARERTQILMDKANMIGALVVGTGDLSELALGWCTYNGDHMSMYGVNAGVPKTLVRYLIEYVADTWDDEEIARILRDVVDTPISPELLPPDEQGEITQETEAVIGPYELHDFFLYYLIRRAFQPDKVRFLAEQAFADTYTTDTITKWLRAFCRRFFMHQFKRSCLPDGPKVGTIALSPRGDWRMPSDASAAEWLRRLDS
jgi:NAD+ synthase (glutamine-hydrolysing)